MDRKLTVFLGLLLGVSALAFTPYLPFFGPGNGLVVTDWSTRVVANDNTLPSQNTIIAMETLRASLVTQGLTNKIYTLCIFVPDSVIAASTPLIKNKGADPWTNSGFVAGDLNIQGLKGNGTSFLDTGVIAIAGATNANQILTNSGISAIVTESATNENRAIILNEQFFANGNDRGLFASAGGIDQFYMGLALSPTVGAIQTNDFGRVGYISGNRENETNLNLYVASPIEVHKLLATRQASPSLQDAFGTNTTFAFYATRIQGTNAFASSLRLSMACLHQGFTETESSNFWWAVKTCRQSLGGGDGDPIWDWARYVTNFGGAAISANTSNALRTFRQGLDTDGLLYKMVAVNALVPDNLTAARMPIVWQAGLQIWTNVLFDATNLTVNGLHGNTNSKYLGTGLNPAGITYAGYGSGNNGQSLLVYGNTNELSGLDFAGTGTSANSLYGLQISSGLLAFFNWKFVGINTNYLQRAAVPAAFWTGYLGGYHTASNAFAVYWVTNSVHNVMTNTTFLMTSGSPTITNLYAFASSAPGLVASAFSDHTISFMSIQAGLTQTQDSNLWNRVKNMRNSLGGGIP